MKIRQLSVDLTDARTDSQADKAYKHEKFTYASMCQGRDLNQEHLCTL